MADKKLTKRTFKQLCKHIESNDLEALQQALEGYFNKVCTGDKKHEHKKEITLGLLAFSDGDGSTALYHAAVQGRVEAMQVSRVTRW